MLLYNVQYHVEYFLENLQYRLCYAKVLQNALYSVTKKVIKMSSDPVKH